ATVDSVDNLIRGLAEQSNRGTSDPSSAEYVRGLMVRLQQSGAALDPGSDALVETALHAVIGIMEHPPAEGRTPDDLRDARLLMRKVMAAELAAQKALVLEKRDTARREQHIALGLLVGLLL